MNIDAIDNALDGAIALLMYGSGAWLACALPIFVVTRSKQSAKEQSFKKQSVEEQSFKKQAIETPVLESAAVEPLEKANTAPRSTEPQTLPEIICEPVNWKRWKVGELRQANITRVCGVRVSPIGSKRKLRKADLIAQYEQNLKRMTGERPNLAVQSEKIA